MKKTADRRKLRKAACILTAGMMIFSVGAVFTGCGKNNNAIVDQAEAMKTLAFTVEDMELDDNLNGVISKNGLLYATSYSYEMVNDYYFSSYSIKVMDEQGNEKLTIPVFKQTDQNEYGYIQGNLSVDDSGNITCMLSRSKNDPETGDYTETLQLITYDPQGNQAAALDLESITTDDDRENNRWFQGYVIDGSGNIVCNMSRCVRVLDSTGKVIFTTDDIDNENGWMNGTILTNTGVPAVEIYEYGGERSEHKLVEIDMNAKGFGTEHILPSNVNSLYSGSGDYICYTSTNTGIAGIRADNYQKENVLNLLNLGVDNSQIDTFTICEDGSFITTAWKWTGMNSKRILSFIRPVDSSQIKEKKILSLGCFYLDWSIRSAIAEFNKTNADYTISVDSYSDNNDTSDWSAALTKFNNEILAGKVPDILLINDNMPYDSYVAKGMFTDMYPLMENDPELNRDAFLPNVLKVLEKDGKLYSIAPSFSIQSFAAKKSRVGNMSSITLEQANEFLAQMPEGATLTNYDQTMTQSDFLSYAISYGGFVDYANGTCSFDTPEFKAILETAKNYPAEINYDELYNNNNDYWTQQELAVKEDRALLYVAYLYDFDSYYRIKNGIIGEDITMVGFPNPNGCGAMLGLSSRMAVSQRSQFKEGAWQFIKSVLLNTVTQEEREIYNPNAKEGDEPVTELRWTGNNFPVLTEQLKNLGTQATIPWTYFNENGELVPEENTYWMNGVEIKMGTITQAEVDAFIEYIKTIDHTEKYDENLNTIINEEASGFFGGTKSADETASMIQSRVSIYMSEQYR